MCTTFVFYSHQYINNTRGCRGRDCKLVGFSITYAISAYHHWCCEFESQTLCDNACQRLATGRWFSPGTPVSSTNKTDDIPEILLKVALTTITQTNPLYDLLHVIRKRSNDHEQIVPSTIKVGYIAISGNDCFSIKCNK